MKIGNQYKIGNLVINTPPEWKDIIETVNDAGAPFTMAKDGGIGAIQFSVAEYRGGELPLFTLSDLSDMRHEFATGRGFSKAFDESTSEGKISASGGSYHADQDLVRVWYCSNGMDIALVTYVSDWDGRNNESKECDDIVSRLEFRKAV